MAERLFAEHGLENVSLRQIAASAGLANPASVQYHFGDRDELIRAIWRKRLPELDRYRQMLFTKARQHGRQPGLGEFMDCFCRPFLTELNDFSQFLARVIRSRHHLQILAEFASLSPATDAILERIRGQFPELDDEVFDFRLLCAMLIVLDAVGPTKTVVPETWQGGDREVAYNQALAVAVGCLTAPRAASSVF